eukprot:scaffold53_cov381-Pavlova_lutheri.AAC.11
MSSTAPNALHCRNFLAALPSSSSHTNAKTYADRHTFGRCSAFTNAYITSATRRYPMRFGKYHSTFPCGPKNLLASIVRVFVRRKGVGSCLGRVLGGPSWNLLELWLRRARVTCGVAEGGCLLQERGLERVVDDPDLWLAMVSRGARLV